MTTFTTRFLGCKVSFADAQAMRERLLGQGHTEVDEGGEIAVVNTCCVTHEAVSKSRQAVSRAARSATTVYATGCASSLSGALDGLPSNVVVTGRVGEDAAAFVAGDVGAMLGVQADAPARTGAGVREDPGRLLVLVRVLCDPAVRGATRSRSARAVLSRDRATGRPGSPRDRPHRRQPRLLSRQGRGVHPRPSCPRGRCDRRARAPAALLDRDQPRHG